MRFWGWSDTMSPERLEPTFYLTHVNSHQTYWRSHQTNNWYSWVQTIYHAMEYVAKYIRLFSCSLWLFQLLGPVRFGHVILAPDTDRVLSLYFKVNYFHKWSCALPCHANPQEPDISQAHNLWTCYWGPQRYKFPRYDTYPDTVVTIRYTIRYDT